MTAVNSRLATRSERARSNAGATILLHSSAATVRDDNSQPKAP